MVDLKVGLLSPKGCSNLFWTRMVTSITRVVMFLNIRTSLAASLVDEFIALIYLVGQIEGK